MNAHLGYTDESESRMAAMALAPALMVSSLIAVMEWRISCP